MSDEVVHVGQVIFSAWGGKNLELAYKKPSNVPDRINLDRSWRVVGSERAIGSFLMSRESIVSSVGRINFTYKSIPLIKVNKATAHLLRLLVPGVTEIAQAIKGVTTTVKLVNSMGGKVEIRIDQQQKQLGSYSTVSYVGKAKEMTGFAAARAFGEYCQKRRNISSVFKNQFRTGMAYQIGRFGELCGYGEDGGEYDLIGEDLFND